jgi:Spy/CpxP family protein refolding chaperone
MKRIIIFLIVVLFAGTAVAQMHGHGKGQMGKPGKAGFSNCDRGDRFGKAHRPGNILRHAEALELTDQQIDKIKSMQLSNQEAMIDLRADLKKLELRLRSEMHSDSPDKNSVMSINAEIAKLKGQISEMRLSHFFELREILTADQVKKFGELKFEDRPMSQGKGAHGMRQRDGSCGH